MIVKIGRWLPSSGLVTQVSEALASRMTGSKSFLDGIPKLELGNEGIETHRSSNSTDAPPIVGTSYKPPKLMFSCFFVLFVDKKIHINQETPCTFSTQSSV